jgi:hypothetical protein
MKYYFHLEFTEWKSSFEQSSGSKYVKNCGSKGKSENQTTEYYYCNRTGPCKYLLIIFLFHLYNLEKFQINKLDKVGVVIPKLLIHFVVVFIVHHQ